MENEETKVVIPTVGMPATYCIGSDRYAGSIVMVSHNARLVGYSDKGSTEVNSFSLRNNGRFYPVGSKIGQGGSLRLGTAEDYRDPSF
jgi:hypothetical protein